MSSNVDAPTAGQGAREGKTFDLRYEILTPGGKIASGSCYMFVAPAIHGEIGILPGHTPFLSALDVGVMRVTSGEKTDHIFVAGGYLEVLDNRVIVLAEIAEPAAAIDVARAQKALERASQRLALTGAAPSEGSALDRLRARRAWTRAKFRLKAAGISFH